MSSLTFKTPTGHWVKNYRHFSDADLEVIGAQSQWGETEIIQAVEVLLATAEQLATRYAYLQERRRRDSVRSRSDSDPESFPEKLPSSPPGGNDLPREREEDLV